MPRKKKAWRGVIAILCLGLALGLGCKSKEPPPPPPEEETAVVEENKPETPPAETKPAATEIKTYRYVLEYRGSGQPEKMRFEYLADNKRFNMKLSLQENNTWKVTTQLISNGADLFMLQPDTKMAIKMPAEEGKSPEGVPAEMLVMPDWGKFTSDHRDLGLTKKGETEINGKKVTHYQTQAGGIKVSYFVDEQNVIRRIQAESADGAELYFMDVIEWQVNPSVSDSDFQVPAGYQVQDLSKMMEGLGGKPIPGLPTAPPTKNMGDTPQKKRVMKKVPKAKAEKAETEATEKAEETSEEGARPAEEEKE